MATYCHSLPLLVLRRVQTAASWELHEMDLVAYRFLKSLPVFVHMLSCYQFTMTRTSFSAPQCNDSVSLTRGSGLTVGLWNWTTAFFPLSFTTYMWHWHNIKYFLPLLCCIMLYSILKVAEPFYSLTQCFSFSQTLRLQITIKAAFTSPGSKALHSTQFKQVQNIYHVPFDSALTKEVTCYTPTDGGWGSIQMLLTLISVMNWLSTGTLKCGVGGGCTSSWPAYWLSGPSIILQSPHLVRPSLMSLLIARF